MALTNPLTSEAFSAFRAAIARRIEETQVNMTDLAKEADVGRPYLYRVLNGEQAPTIPVAEKIAMALGLIITVQPSPPPKRRKKAG